MYIKKIVKLTTTGIYANDFKKLVENEENEKI